jgi:hypothetical protein
MKKIIFVILVVVLTLNIFTNFLGIVDHDWFETNEENSDSLILGKIVRMRTQEPSKDAMFLSWISNSQGKYIDHLSDKNPASSAQFEVYISSIGLQGTLFSLISMLLFWMDFTTLMSVFSLINALLLSALLVLFVFWVYRQFGLFTAIITFITTFLTQWLLVFGHSVYWSIWLCFLPFVVSLLLLENFEKKGIYITKKLGIWVAITVFLKCAAGYEYISTILIMTMLPLIFYAYKNQWRFKVFLNRFLSLCGYALLGFAFAILIHLIMIAILNEQGLMSALNELEILISRRTSLGDVAKVADPKYAEMRDVPLSGILARYLVSGFEPYTPLFKIAGKSLYMKHFIYLLGFTSLISVIDRSFSKTIFENRRKITALCLISLISLMGPVSWYVLAKSHSYVHPHLNYILWSMPSTILIFTSAAYIFGAIVKDFFRKKRQH